MNYCWKKSISLGCTPSASASLRTVFQVGFCFPFSSRHMVLNATPVSWDRSRWLRALLSRNSFSLIAVNKLGLPQTPVRETVEKAVNWFRENGYVKST